MAYSSFVTEAHLAANYTPKAGISPGSNNTLCMDCDQILARYQVSISGATTTGKRLPSQNQILDAPPIKQNSANAFWGSDWVVSMVTTITKSDFFVLCITSNGTRTGGGPTFSGLPMTLVSSLNNVEMWVINYTTTNIAISVPNNSYTNVICILRSYSYMGTIIDYSSASESNAPGYTEISTSINQSYPNLIVGFMSFLYISGIIPPDNSGYDTNYVAGGGVSLSAFSQSYIYRIPPNTSTFTMWYDSPAHTMNHIMVAFYVY